MTEWTPEAKQRLDDYLNQVDRLSRSMGDDATEIVDGLREHISTEAESVAPSLVTLGHLERLLASIGTPQQVTEYVGRHEKVTGDEAVRLVEEIAREHGEKRLTQDYSDRMRGCVLFFGICIPSLALMVEFFGGIMAGMYLDPIPSIWHVLAGILLLVSLAIGDVTIARLVYGKTVRRPRLVLLLNAYATALAAVYFVVYAPMLPVSTVMIIALGGGLLGFAPLFCMLSGLYHMRLLHRLIPEETVPRRLARKSTCAGVLIVCVLTAAYACPAMWMRHLIRQAVSDDAGEREHAVGWIRTLHLDGAVLEACYHRPGWGRLRDDSDPDVAWALDTAAYHELYYRLTGKSHRSVPRPDMPGNSPFAGRVASDEELMESWNDIGGTEVAGRARGLRLKGSAIDANVAAFNADGSGPALAYIEWILEFRNTDDWEKEARAHIEMPPGGVPSRLTLWIDGEERDAAYGTRQQTRDAYRSVVQRRRDPALLNVVGPDVAMLQCFPVPPAGTMKVKVGITAPLIVRGGKSYLRLPYISECNFAIDAKTEHAVWVEFPAGMGGRAEGLVQEPGQDSLVGLRGKLTEKALQDPASATLEFAYANADGQTFAGELNGARAQAIPRSASSANLRRICFVLDGSVFMDKTDIDWDRVMQALAGKSEVAAIFAGQKVETYSESFVAPDAALATWFKSRTFEGGCDAAPALEKAWSLLSAQAQEGGAVVWVYGPQVVELSSAEGLNQWMRRRPAGDNGQLAFLAVPALPGPNRVLNSLTGMVERVPAIGSLTDTLISCVQNGTGNELALAYRLASEAATSGPNMNPSASDHMVRLAVNDAVAEAFQSSDAARKTEAAKLAQSVRIVTPLTGAVVLQTKEQYDAAGLDPSADEDAIPGIPEPEEWALLIVVAFVLLIVALKSKAARRAAHMAK